MIMVAMHRVRLQWTGFVSGPAVSTLFFTPSADSSANAQTVVNRVAAFMTSIKSSIYGSCTWTVSGQVDVIDDHTGDLNGSWGVTGASDGGSGSVNPVPQANQLNIRFETGVVYNGKRVRGHMYIPGSCTFNAAGAPSGAILTQVPANMAALLGPTHPLTIWRRPIGPHGSINNGLGYPATAGLLQPKYAVLRSRRD